MAGRGNEAITLYIHQDVLSRNSEFFKRVVKPEWAELREDPDTIDMGPMHTAEEVKSYAHWLYSGSIPTRDFDRENGSKSDPIWIDLVLPAEMPMRMKLEVDLHRPMHTFSARK